MILGAGCVSGQRPGYLNGLEVLVSGSELAGQYLPLNCATARAENISLSAWMRGIADGETEEKGYEEAGEDHEELAEVGCGDHVAVQTLVDMSPRMWSGLPFSRQKESVHPAL